MSGKRDVWRTRSGRVLLGLYPEPWRARYGQEILELLEDDPPAALGLASLVLGAARAHIRPQRGWQEAAGRETLMRLAVGAMFACWIAISVAGIGFQKETEDSPYGWAAAHHPLLGIAHGVIIAGAGLGALSIAVGGLPLLWEALRAARARREPRLLLLICAPALALLALIAVTGVLLLVAPRRNGFPASFVLSILVPWVLAIWAFAAVCALVPRAVLARIEPTPQALRRACLAGLALAGAMYLVAGGLITYAISLTVSSPLLAVSPTGPLGTSTAAMIGVEAGVAATMALCGGIAALRGRRAAYAAVVA
ncbi:MAG: hypothetical protein ACRDK2_04635 [Solirubrobacteraceae bacterium]